MLNKFLTGILLALLFFFVSLNAQDASAAVSNWQQSASFQSGSTTDFASEGFKQSLRNLKATGANSATLIIPWTQSNLTSTDIRRTWNTPTDETLINAIQYAHSIGMQVTLKPHIDPESGEWRAHIYPTDRDTWFANYNAMLSHYGRIAQTYGVEQMCVGAELWRVSSAGQNFNNTARWQSMISNLRTLYTGKLTYSANHTGPSEIQEVQFWNSLDYIGVSAYFPLAPNTDNPSLDTLKQAWAGWNSSHIAPLYQKWGKPIIFTEIGYKSVPGAHKEPFAWWRGGGVDQGEQARDYEALFSYWNTQSFMHGVHLWEWKTNPNAGGANDMDYTPQNKQAQAVMSQWFGGGAVTPTPTTGNPAEATYELTAAITPASPGVNQQATLNAIVKANQNLTGLLIDVEIYNSQNQKIFQRFFSNETLSANQAKLFPITWTPTSTGVYTVKMGVFSNDWTKNYRWQGNVMTFTVGQGGTTPTPTPTTITTPSPTPTTTPTTTPAPTTPPTQGTIDIWWPGNNVSINGVHPFKALVPGLTLSQYVMYWQVDGGTLNQMADSQQDAPHKESWVNVSGWSWRGNGPYTITFVAKNATGGTIAQKSTAIFISR